MYTLLLHYTLRKFITTKVLANNEYEEDQLAKAEGYLTKLLQVVPEFRNTGKIVDSGFVADGTQLYARAEFDVPADSEEEAAHYLDRYASDIPDYSNLKVLQMKKAR